jgi:hypothetical protein
MAGPHAILAPFGLLNVSKCLKGPGDLLVALDVSMADGENQPSSGHSSSTVSDQKMPIGLTRVQRHDRRYYAP